MKLLDGLIDKAKSFLVGKMLKKAAVQVAIGAGSLIASKQGLLENAGISINLDPDMVALALIGGLNSLRNLLKVKMPKVFGWL